MRGIIIRKLWAPAMLALVVITFTGCTDQTAEANNAIDSANVQIGRYAAAGAKLEKQIAEIQAMPVDGPSALKAKARTDAAKVTLGDQRTAAEAARAQLARIRDMQVREEFKAYAAKEIAVTETLLAQDEVAKSLLGRLADVYALVSRGNATKKELDEIARRIEADGRKIDELERRAAQLEKEAGEYFDANALGGK